MVVELRFNLNRDTATLVEIHRFGLILDIYYYVICALLITTENKYETKIKIFTIFKKIARHLIPIWNGIFLKNQKQKPKKIIQTWKNKQIDRFCRRQSMIYV